VSIWAPVVAALGASVLTGGFGFGTIWWQQRKRDRGDAAAQKSEAYHQLISHSLSFTIRAQALRNTMRSRSGLNERLDLALRLRRPIDPMELHDWFAQGYEPMNQAWSKVEVIGSPDAVDVATQLLDACADYVGMATELGTARGRVATYLKGLHWTREQEDALEATARRVIEHRRAFIKITRRELGQEPVPPFQALPDRKAAENQGTTSGPRLTTKGEAM
jgi:hypothetical protein